MNEDKKEITSEEFTKRVMELVVKTTDKTLECFKEINNLKIELSVVREKLRLLTAAQKVFATKLERVESSCGNHLTDIEHSVVRLKDFFNDRFYCVYVNLKEFKIRIDKLTEEKQDGQ